MGLTTAQDFAVLNSWGFLKDYSNNQVALLAVGKTVFQAIRAFTSWPPQAIDVERPFAAALRVTDVFKAICASKAHANPALYAVFALAFARYMLDFEWQVIAGP
jgi:hypothetical protein